jgi:hypothetical protein
MKKIFFQKTQKGVVEGRKMFFCFFKKKYFSQKNGLKLSVFETGHFWICPQIRLTNGLPHGID